MLNHSIPINTGNYMHVPFWVILEPPCPSVGFVWTCQKKRAQIFQNLCQLLKFKDLNTYLSFREKHALLLFIFVMKGLTFLGHLSHSGNRSSSIVVLHPLKFLHFEFQGQLLQFFVLNISRIKGI